VSDLFIVDNGDRNWKVKNYLHKWADSACMLEVSSVADLRMYATSGYNREPLFTATYKGVRIG
jgi:hypothetical protein